MNRRQPLLKDGELNGYLIEITSHSSRAKENRRTSRTFCLLTALTVPILAVGLFQWPPSGPPSSQARDPSPPPAAAELNVSQPAELQQGLGSLPYLNHARSRSVCAENPGGTKGKGGMAVPNPSDPSPPASARAADDLGQDWKVRPFLRVNKGQTATLMDVDGPGVIRHSSR
jgi:hypothetical protein